VRNMRSHVIACVCMLALALSGCTVAKEFFTDPTGRITIERQEFIDFYATTRVLYRRLYEHLDDLCAKGEAPERTCQRLPLLHEQVRELDIRIQAKIEVPESRIDWANVAKLLGALISLVP